MTSPGAKFFGPWEEVISNWDDAVSGINEVINKAHGRRMVWRGVVDAGYSLHSSIYRRLRSKLGRVPDESDVLKLEERILRRARRDWRYDNLSALELFAHLQHYGGPTRLLDVTYSPFVALWFSVEQKYDSQGIALADVDGRLFAFDVTDRQIELDDVWAARGLPWQDIDKQEWRRFLPKVWRPPSYNERIPAQDSAFLLGGVPMIYAGDNSKFYRKSPGAASTMGLWHADEVREATSVPVRLNALSRSLTPAATPTYTLRIEASCKQTLRDLLGESFGFRQATMYPDLFGLANNVANGL